MGAGLPDGWFSAQIVCKTRCDDVTNLGFFALVGAGLPDGWSSAQIVCKTRPYKCL